MSVLDSFNRITLDEYVSFLVEYNSGQYPHQRLGQAFLNAFYPGVVHPSLFYAVDIQKINDLVFDIYILSENGDNLDVPCRPEDV